MEHWYRIMKMDENEVSCLLIDGHKNDGLYPMYFGVSCAFMALQLLSTVKKMNLPSMGGGGWSSLSDSILQGSTQLLGLLVWKAQAQREQRIAERSELLTKLQRAETDITEMKRRRREDAKANEKVVTIFAAQEQSWLREKKQLRQHLHAALEELHVLRTKACSSCAEKEGTISNLKETTEEKDDLIESKVKALEEEHRQRKDLEEKLQKAEAVAEELQETLKKEAQEHSSLLWKHKTVFIELVSNQRQLEAEMGRALRRVEATKEEFDSVLQQKEEAIAIVQKLSAEVVQMQKDLDQKDKIVSAMLRKSRLDTTEKQKLLKELKISKARRKQAELETERWSALCESKDRSKHSKQLGSNSANRANSRSEISSEVKRFPSIETVCSQNQKAELEKHRKIRELQPGNSSLRWSPKTLLLQYLEAEKKMNIVAVDNINHYSPEGNGDPLIPTDARQLEDWVRSETEKYTTVLEERHYAEVEAFAEQMRLKDEKVEAFRWQLMSMELESKRLQSHIEGLNEKLLQLRDENLKLEALSSDKEKDLESLREKFTLHAKHCRSNSNDRVKSPVLEPEAMWSEVKIIKRKLREKEQEHKATLVRVSQEAETEFRERDNRLAIMEAKLIQTTLQYEKERKEKERIALDIIRTRSASVAGHFNDQLSDESHAESATKLVDAAESQLEGSSSGEIEKSENPTDDQSKDMSSTVQAPKTENEEEKVLTKYHGIVQEEGTENNCREEVEVASKSACDKHCLTRKDSSWKMDFHALGVSYKIKRLKQQLLMLEKLNETQAMKKENSKNNAIHMAESCEKGKPDQHGQIKGFILTMSLLNKQVRRYQTLEEKADNLCKRMHKNDREVSTRDSNGGRKQTEGLEQFLEETFQLQRYMVATGQRLVEIQSVIAHTLVASVDGLNESMGFNVKQFADSVRTLLMEIQRGLEVRIARIIGDLEGTLACEGIMHLQS